MAFVIFFLLAWFIFCFILLMLPGSISRRSLPRPIGDKERRSDTGSRGDMSGVREPRNPKPPYWPPQAAAVIPEDGTLPEASSVFGFSDSPRQPLRLEDGLAT